MTSERQTRKEIIDIKLKKAGWNVSDKSQVTEELYIYIGFPSRYDLERMIYIRNNKKILTHELINTKIACRDYQIKGIRGVFSPVEIDELVNLAQRLVA